jgi:hypothetical protein
MSVNENLQKTCPRFFCKYCDYGASRKSSYDDHLLSAKHQKSTIVNIVNEKNGKICTKYTCKNCNKVYKDNSGLWRHNKKCVKVEDTSNKVIEPAEKSTDVVALLLNQNMELIKQNQEFKDLIVEQNNKMIEMAKEAKTINNTTNNNTNNFNLQFFLNEQCKDALNIMDFINQLQLNTTDLDMVGRLGYTEGISKLFIRGLKALDVFKRPVHCSDLKREVLYVKDKDSWEKDNDEKNKMKTAIKYIAAKNFKQINEWRAKNPESDDYDSQRHMDYHQIVIHSMGGSTKEEDEQHYNKIIRNVAKESVIDKAEISKSK